MKIALVTGGNKGIGLELCRNLAQAGYRVLLGARDRIVNVCSGLGSLSINSDPEWLHYDTRLIGYNASKAAMNMLTVQLAWELHGTKVKANSANIGFIKTDLNGNRGTQPVEVGAIAATRFALIEDDGLTDIAVSKGGHDPW